jgi:DNA-binding beta-propeller fold protein YncE
VSDTGNNRVQVLRYSDGTHVRTIGGGQFNAPCGVAVDSDGHAAVFDCGNNRVQVCRLSDGRFLRSIGCAGSGVGQFFCRASGIAFDYEGNLVVADESNHRVQVLRYSDGAPLRTIDRGMDSPTGIAFDADGHIVVVGHGTHSVQVLRYSDGAHVRTIGGGATGSRQLFARAAWLGPVSGGVAVDGGGRIAVADTYNHAVLLLE